MEFVFSVGKEKIFCRWVANVKPLVHHNTTILAKVWWQWRRSYIHDYKVKWGFCLYVFSAIYSYCNMMRFCSLIGNVLPPLPAQRNLTPPPTLYPQQPVLTPDNYNIPRFRAPESSSIRTKRTDINVWSISAFNFLLLQEKRCLRL